MNTMRFSQVHSTLHLFRTLSKRGAFSCYTRPFSKDIITKVYRMVRIHEPFFHIRLTYPRKMFYCDQTAFVI